MRSIFRKRNPDVEGLFADTGDPSKVMCVAFDYAKKSRTSVICNGLGHQLHGVFDAFNNRAGLDYLFGLVAGLRRKHGIKNEQQGIGVTALELGVQGNAPKG